VIRLSEPGFSGLKDWHDPFLCIVLSNCLMLSNCSGIVFFAENTILYGQTIIANPRMDLEIILHSQDLAFTKLINKSFRPLLKLKEGHYDETI
jgi:hypothetical protein